MINLDVSIFEDEDEGGKRNSRAIFWRLYYYLCGINIADIATLKVSHLNGGLLKKNAMENAEPLLALFTEDTAKNMFEDFPKSGENTETKQLMRATTFSLY